MPGVSQSQSSSFRKLLLEFVAPAASPRSRIQPSSYVLIVTTLPHLDALGTYLQLSCEREGGNCAQQFFDAPQDLLLGAVH